MAAIWVGEVGRRPLGFWGDLEWVLAEGAPGVKGSAVNGRIGEGTTGGSRSCSLYTGPPVFRKGVEARHAESRHGQRVHH